MYLLLCIALALVLSPSNPSNPNPSMFTPTFPKMNHKTCSECKQTKFIQEFMKSTKQFRSCRSCRKEVFKIDFINWKGLLPDLPVEILIWIGGFLSVQDWMVMRLVCKVWGRMPFIPLLAFEGFR
jgi:uncharacterized protein (DUF983 family)